MSWEVLTMRSATSFFNPALARSDLLDRWLLLLKKQGEDAAFPQIRRELKDPAY